MSAAAVVVVAALGGTVSWAAARRRHHRSERLATVEQAQWEQQCRSLLVHWPLPTVQDADLYQLGVFLSRRAEAYRPAQAPRPPYVPRAADKDLVGLLRSQPLVLIIGRSRAGKSRTAFEVAAHALADWRLLVPRDRAALTAIAGLDPAPGQGEPVLAWLDDLERFLSTGSGGGLNTALLDRWAASNPPVRVVATIRLEEYGRLMVTQGELGRSVRQLLERFDPGTRSLSGAFDDPDEQAAIAQLYRGEQVTGGLAEHLAAAKELVDRFEVGEARIPHGAAVVRAAVDWRRSGLDRPIAKTDLAALLPIYLEQLRPDVAVQEGDVDRGLGWATDPVERTAALLVPYPDPLAGTFRVADPIVDHVERRHGRALADPAVWQYVLAHSSVEESIAVGFTAYTRGDGDAAAMAWKRVASSSHPEEAAIAAFNLGLLLEEQGDTAGARTAYQHAIEDRLQDKAPEEAVALLEERVGVTGAHAILRQVIDAVRPGETPAATVSQGRQLEEQDDMIGALAAYQQAIDSGHPDEKPTALVNLGLLLRELGNPAGARAAYQQAIDSGHPDEKPTAAFNLGVLLEEEGDLDGALAAYQQAIDSGHPDAAPRAAVNVGVLLEEEGDLDGALAAYQQAIDSGHPDEGPAAAFNLAVLLHRQGGAADARAAYQRVIDSGHRDTAPRAMVNLGVLLHAQGDRAGARALLREAISSGHPEAARLARQALNGSRDPHQSM